MGGCRNWSRRFLLDSRFGPDLVQIWSRFGPDPVQIEVHPGPGRHWIGGKKAGKVVSVQRNIFWREKAMIRHVYFQSCGAHFYIQRSTSSVPPKRNNLTTFYNILQHFTIFYNIYNIYNIHTTFTTFYNILQHYPWRCVVSPEGR
jgi:hypothetical protein